MMFNRDSGAILHMIQPILTDAQWARIADLLPGKPTDRGGRATDNRQFVEAVLFLARTGRPWRQLPAEAGHWHSVYVRFCRWEQYGVWHEVAELLGAEPSLAPFFAEAPRPSAEDVEGGALRKTIGLRRQVVPKRAS